MPEKMRMAAQDTHQGAVYTDRAVAVTSSQWSPSSWRDFEALQQPEWPDPARAHAAVGRLKQSPPLVFAGEARRLQDDLAAVYEGRAFLLQAGDCAESFNELSQIRIREKLKIMLQMSAVLTYGATLPIVKVGRIAGQFTKPRSATTEVVGDVELPVFRGHMIHDDAPTAEARMPDPMRMVEGYNQAAQTLNLLRAFTKGGFADLTQVQLWNKDFVASSPEGLRYQALADDIERALQFMAACGIDLKAERRLHEVDVFTSHEGLLLDYEEGLTRKDSLTGDWYDCSAHMLWVGERTRQPDGAHVEFFAGVHNPLGAKIGPTATADELIALCEKLNPARVPGRLTFIARMGAGRVQELLPPLLRVVREEGHPVVWACDPMHENVFKTADGFKTRRFDDVMGEIEGFFAACWGERIWPGGVHLEYTGEDVTECLGGGEEVLEEQLSHRYETLCDPRLNARQSLDLAFRLAELMRQKPRS
jgi:3-deoxy-7-phosphoheptulonate synthase